MLKEVLDGELVLILKPVARDAAGAAMVKAQQKDHEHEAKHTAFEQVFFELDLHLDHLVLATRGGLDVGTI